MDVMNNKIILGNGVVAEELYRKLNAGRPSVPVYAYEMDVITEQLIKMLKFVHRNPPKNHGFKLKFLYARKANEDPTVVKHILDSDMCLFKRDNLTRVGSVSFGIDAVSIPEIHGSLEGKVSSDDIQATFPHMNTETMLYLINKNITPTISSMHELKEYARLKHFEINDNAVCASMVSGLNGNAFPLGRIEPEIFVRINFNEVKGGHHLHCYTNGLESHFGVPEDQLPDFAAEAKRLGVKIAGVHTHMGSGIKEVDKFHKIMQVLTHAVERYKLDDVRSLDFGGGFGTDYSDLLSKDHSDGLMQPNDFDFCDFWPEAYNLMEDFCRRNKKEYTFMFEPGRFFVARAGTLLGEIVTKKHNSRHEFACTNIGFTDLMRKRLYGSHHEVVNASKVYSENYNYILPGPKCESGDKFNDVIVVKTKKGTEERYEDTMISHLSIGDVIGIRMAGAYGYVMGSSYNMGPRPMQVAIYPLKNGHDRVKILSQESPNEAYKALTKGEKHPFIWR